MGIQKLFLLLAALLLVTLAGCSGSDSVVLVESEVRDQIKNKISQEFPDPGNTRFDQVSFSSYDPEEKKFVSEFIPEATSLMFCGQVNGTNRFGGSTGPRKFAALYSPPLDSESEPDVEVVFENHHLFSSFSRDCP